jgi:hypothetical protein
MLKTKKEMNLKSFSLVIRELEVLGVVSKVDGYITILVCEIIVANEVFVVEHGSQKRSKLCIYLIDRFIFNSYTSCPVIHHL